MKNKILLAILCVLCVASSVANDVLFYDIARRMQPYKSFLLYGTCLIYTILFGLWGCYRVMSKRKDGTCADSFIVAFVNRKNQGKFFKLGILNLFLGVFLQYSNNEVDGNLQTAIYQIAIPVCGLFSWFLFGARFSLVNLLGTLVVIGGCLMVALPPLVESGLADANITSECDNKTQDDSVAWEGGWIVIFTVGTSCIAGVMVYTQVIFDNDPDTEISLACFWSSLYATFMFVLCVPIQMLPPMGGFTWAEVWQLQVDSFKCFAQTSPLPCGCDNGALISVLLYGVCHFGFLFFQSRLIMDVNAVFLSIILGINTPLSAVVFSFTWLLGGDAEPITAWVIGGCITVPIGIVVFYLQDVIILFRAKAGQELQGLSEEDESLLNINSLPRELKLL